MKLSESFLGPKIVFYMVLAYIEKGSLARGRGWGGGAGREGVLSFAYKNNLHLRGNDFNTRQNWGVISLIKTLVKRSQDDRETCKKQKLFHYCCEILKGVS